jgi:uncharacterized protein Yka (UPF0111/DUF47 family)
MNEFVELVREMRNAQKEYFKTRDKNVLQRIKELERKVDAFPNELLKDYIRQYLDYSKKEIVKLKDQLDAL